MNDNILVIKLGALGDFIQAMGPMAAIRKHHNNAKITLLTTASFEKFAKECGYFDEIILDQRPKWHQIGRWISLRSRLIAGQYSRVYDLQNNDVNYKIMLWLQNKDMFYKTMICFTKQLYLPFRIFCTLC